MTRFQGAVIKEQGITFAIIIVKKHIIDSKFSSDNMVKNCQSIFSGIPIVLMAQDYKGIPHYYGRTDIVNFMIKVPLQAVPWKEYTVT